MWVRVPPRAPIFCVGSNPTRGTNLEKTMSEKEKTKILERLIEIASLENVFKHPRDLSRKVGQLIVSLPPDQREYLKTLKSFDVRNPRFTGVYLRPEQQPKRLRGPVKNEQG